MRNTRRSMSMTGWNGIARAERQRLALDPGGARARAGAGTRAAGATCRCPARRRSRTTWPWPRLGLLEALGRAGAARCSRPTKRVRPASARRTTRHAPARHAGRSSSGARSKRRARKRAAAALATTVAGAARSPASASSGAAPPRAPASTLDAVAARLTGSTTRRGARSWSSDAGAASARARAASVWIGEGGVGGAARGVLVGLEAEGRQQPVGADSSTRPPKLAHLVGRSPRARRPAVPSRRAPDAAAAPASSVIAGASARRPRLGAAGSRRAGGPRGARAAGRRGAAPASPRGASPRRSHAVAQRVARDRRAAPPRA